MDFKDYLRWIVYYSGYCMNKNDCSKIIYYHDVYDDSNGGVKYTSMSTPLSLLISHVNIIKKTSFRVAPFIDNAKRQIQITFDDGFKGIWDNRFYFYENEICPTVFIANKLIGMEGYLTVENIKELKKHGFSFQSHTYSHVALTKLNTEQLYHELNDSKYKLEDIFECSFDEICFPMGCFSDQVYQMSLSVGYKKMYSSIPGNYFDNMDVDLYYRNLVQGLSPKLFEWALLGGMEILRSHYKKLHYKK